MIITRDLSITDYHASTRLSTSKLKTFADHGALAFKARHLTAENRQEPTDAMILGQAFEDLVQLPADVFRAQWQEAPADEGKADDDLLAEAVAVGATADEGKPFSKRHGASTVRLAVMRAKGINVLARKDFVTIERMAASVDRNADVQAAIKGAQTQVSLLDDWLDMIPGLQARPDWWHDTGETIDLKSTAKFSAFDSEILNRKMHAQAALIDMVTGVRSSRHLVACENVWPYRCQLIELSSTWLDVGRAWCDEQIAALRVCYERDVWPLCATKRTSEPPRWAARMVDDE